MERFNVQFLGSVEVPYHQGNGILCAAMQKVSPREGDGSVAPPSLCRLGLRSHARHPPPCPQIATTRKLTVHLRPPASCDLEITLQGIKLILTVTEYSRDEEVRGAGGGAGCLPCHEPGAHTSGGFSLPV